MAEEIQFKLLAEAALARVESLLAQWLPDGKRVGHEWKALNPTRADGRPGSFSINMATGAWGDFACDDAGGDLVSLNAYLFHGSDQVAAARELADTLNMPEAVPPLDGGHKPRARRETKPAQPAPASDEPVAERKPKWVPIAPVPADVPEPPKAHEFRGVPQMLWTYRAADGGVLGYVGRFLTSDGGKEVIPLSWCRHERTGKEAWRWLSFAEPRPLYGLDRLAARPDATVMVVEGEKCADVGAANLPDLVVVCWPGGTNAVDKVDWSPLYGRKVIGWPDCDSKRKKLTREEKAAGLDPMSKPFLAKDDQPGMKAMRWIAIHLTANGSKVWLKGIPPPGEVADGFDIADAVEAGLVGEDLAAHVRDHSVLWTSLCPDSPTPESISTATEAAAEEGMGWRDNLYRRNGELDDCLANVYDILAHRREWAGVVAFDEFSQRTVKLKPPPYAHGEVGEWESADDSRTAIWLTHHEYITPSSTRVAEAVETLGRANMIHPVRDWLKTLPAWDKTPRVDHWLCDYLGVPDSEYVRKVARFYLVGMIARVMEPGCKFDYCLVLEGKQGKGKSTAFRILGGEWYGDTDLDLHNKDSMSALRGKWVYEFAELGSVTRAESTKQKSFLSRQVDEYRPVYGRREIKAPRQVVFGGTTNEWEWNKDPTGGRRFWPVDCADDLNLQGLQDNREQMFAEALALYLAKERYWPSPEEQQALFDPQQLLREQPESLVDALHDWAYAQVADFSVATAVMDGLKLDASKLTRDLQTRVGIALRKLGCQKVEKRNGMVRYWYKPPTRNGATSETGSAGASEQSEGGRHAYF